MSIELMNHYLEILTTYVYDNDKAVTYKWLSKELEVHVNVAKQVLWEFWQRHQDENNIESTVMLIGNLKSGGMRVEVVKQSNLDAAKDKFNNIISEHLYSIQKSIPDLDSLFMNDKGDVRFSAIKCNESVERSDEELSILRWGSIFSSKNHPIPEQDNKLKSINKSENIQMFEMNEHNQTNKKSTDKKTIPISQKTGFNNLFAKIPNKEKDIIPSTSKFTCINKEISPKQKSIDSQNSSSKESKSVKKKEKNDIASFFGKSSDVTKDSNQEEQTDNSMKDDIEDNAKTQVTFIKDNDKPKKETRGIKRNRSKESKNTIKKRKRIIVNDDLTDSQSEDEHMKSIESESEEEIEIENLDKKEKSSSPYMMDNSGKARILKLVDQTYEEDGFLVTRKIHVYENCSENVTESREKEEIMKKESEGVAKLDYYFTFDICTKCLCSVKGTGTIINCHEKLITNDKIQLNSLMLDQYQNVEELILSKNNLTLVSPSIFMILKHVKKLDLSENLMSEIYINELAKFNNLDELNYSNNKLKIFNNVIFDKISTIIKLNLSHNCIKILKSTTISKPVISLIIFDLSYNDITFIDNIFLKPFLHLKHLDLSFNKITSISENAFSQLLDLRTLRINNNFLISLKFNELPDNLIELHIEYNKVVKLLYEPSQIQGLNIEFNNISRLETNLACLHSLEYLNVSGNKLAKFPNVMLQRLKVLDISNNNYSNIPKYLSSENYPLLSILIVSGNLIKDLTFHSKLKLRSFVANNITLLEKINNDAFLKLEAPIDDCINLTISNNKKLISIDEKALDHMNACFVDLSNNNINYISPKLLLFNDTLKMSNGIDLQGNPFACNCSLQWMLSDLIPQLYVINPSILNDLRCATPLNLLNIRLVHWYKWKKEIFCNDMSELLSNFSEKYEAISERKVIMIESSPELFAILGSAIILLIVLFVIGILLTQKLEKKRSRQNRRF
ncbi:DNA polymerase delta subunit 3-like [Vespula squamosa]|uniref:DNA polymerase delta subunit 3-like n=1 Tax=Vespula squamosa TaxID=30214 RepID=A0ABD2B9K3_VESSQ